MLRALLGTVGAVAACWLPLAGGCRGETVAVELPAAVDLGFEDGKLGRIPHEWFVPAEGWTATLADGDAAEGERSARLELRGESQAPFGNLMRNVDAAPYRAQRVRLSAKIRLDGDAGADAKAMMWLRVDRPNRQVGFFDNMGNRPITSTKWADAVIEGDVDGDAASFALGVMSLGGATVLVDQMRLESVVPVSTCFAVTRALPITAPLASVTVPWIVARPAWPNATPETETAMAATILS